MFSSLDNGNKNTQQVSWEQRLLKNSGRNKGSLKPEYQELKFSLHRKLVDKINLEALASIDNQRVRAEVRQAVIQLIDAEPTLLSSVEKQQISDEVLDEVFGLGPLEPLLQDPGISDILVNTYRQVYIERKGLLELTNVTFRDNQHLLRIIDKIVSQVGRRIDESTPMVDARLSDGSRVNAIIPPLAVDGPLLSIRRFSTDKLMPPDLVDKKAMTPGMMELLEAAVKARMNIIIAGGTGAGKTTLLNALSAFISSKERIVTIEDAAELQLKQPHVARLETRPAQPGRQWCGAAERIAGQQPPYASRPHRGRRSSWRGSVGHAAGHEHRSRRQLDHRPRQYPSRCCLASRSDGVAGQCQHAGGLYPPADRSRRACAGAGFAYERWVAPRGFHYRGNGHGGRSGHAAGSVCV